MLKFRKEEPQLWNKLDSISAMLESFVKQEIAITSEIAKERIHSIVYAEQIAAEKERAEAEAKALEEGQATNFNDLYPSSFVSAKPGNERRKAVQPMSHLEQLKVTRVFRASSRNTKKPGYG